VVGGGETGEVVTAVVVGGGDVGEGVAGAAQAVIIKMATSTNIIGPKRIFFIFYLLFSYG